MKKLKTFESFLNEGKINEFFNKIGQTIKKMLSNPAEKQKIDVEEVENEPKVKEPTLLVDFSKQQQQIKDQLIEIANDIKDDFVKDFRDGKITWKQNGINHNQIWYKFKNGDKIYFEFINGGKGSTMIYNKGYQQINSNMNVFFTQDFINLFEQLYTYQKK